MLSVCDAAVGLLMVGSWAEAGNVQLYIQEEWPVQPARVNYLESRACSRYW